MKIVRLVFIIFFISIGLDANEKWISFEKETKKEQPKATTQNSKNMQINLANLNPAQRMINKIKLAKYFLDRVPQKKQSSKQEQKKWFKIQNIKN